MTHLPYLDCDFFEALLKKYPLAHKAFFMWLARFKERPECVAFFHPASVHPSNHPSWAEMPGPLQIGIWIEFIVERGGCQWHVEDLFTHDWKQDITEMFELMHEELSISERNGNIAEETAMPTAASTIRTPDEIKRQIYCLMAMKQVEGRWSAVAIAGLDAQIEILTGAATTDNYQCDEFDEDFDSRIEILMEAELAEEWLLGYKDRAGKPNRDVFDATELPLGFKIPELNPNGRLVEPLYFGIFGEQQ